MESVKMNMNNIEEELNATTNNMVCNFIMDKLGELKGMDSVVDYEGDISCFYVIHDTHVATIKCCDGLVHYIRIYGIDEAGEETQVDVNIDNIKNINGKVEDACSGEIDIILGSGVVNIQYE